MMLKNFAILLMCVLVSAIPMSGARNDNAEKTAASKVAAHSEAEGEEMHYASISRTNPFEIVSTPGMALNDLDGGEAMVNDLMESARKFIGTRYVSGGKTPKGFDCSGFTSYVFRQFGVSLNSSSATQYQQGESVERNEVEAGDLLFFTGRNAGSKRVGHVGIAIDCDAETGEITFIHAAIGGGIRIDKTSAPYYSARYIGARRVL